MLSIALAPLTERGGSSPFGGLLDPQRIATIVGLRPEGSARAHHRYAHRALREALREAFRTFTSLRAGGDELAMKGVPAADVRRIARQLEELRSRSVEWLEKDALYEALFDMYGGVSFRHWRGAGSGPGRGDLDQRLFSPRPGEETAAARRIQELHARFAGEIELYAFGQLIVHEQHKELRQLVAELGLKLYGDLQIGFSERDVWSYQGLFLQGFLMGAPPSRTNPEGQPWNYPVLDPDQYLMSPAAGGTDPVPGPALRLMRDRIDKLFYEFDGVRIDHPHGLVCPWVYRAGAEDPLLSVQRGARLFASPDLPDFPELARLSIATAAQINRSTPRYADDWVLSLSPEQVARYGVLLDSAVMSAQEHGRDTSDLICEVLSTLPYPVRRVLERYGLGRFRVTQKANLNNPSDVYRSENAAPEDWIMVGNHDTKPIWRLVDEWQQSGAARDQAEYLAARLLRDEASRSAFAEDLAAHPGRLAQAKLADLFVSRAQNVMIFFSDLLGVKEIFNRPGVVSEENWRIRVPNDFEADYDNKLSQGAALNLPKALATAMRARGGDLAAGNQALLERLDSLAAELERGCIFSS
jgi:4-alpha-glucanotransferase